jgi:PKD repeat protein
MHWKQQASLSCSYAAPKCLCVTTNIVLKAPLIANFSYLACNNGSSSAVTFTSSATGGAGPYAYSWNFGDGTTSTLANPTKVYANPGPYTATLTVTDNVSATNAISKQVTLPTQVATPTVSIIQPTCTTSTGGIIVNTPTGSGMTYSINGTIYQSSNTFSGLSSGSYNVTAKNSTGCLSAIFNAVITAQPLTTLSTTNAAICSNRLPYSWNGSRTSAGTYTFISTNSQGCDSTATLNLTVNDSTALSAITGNTTIFVTSTTTLSNSTSGGTWSSSNTAVATINSSTGIAAGILAGTNTITYSVSNASGCTSTTTTIVTINPRPNP